MVQNAYANANATQKCLHKGLNCHVQWILQKIVQKSIAFNRFDLKPRHLSGWTANEIFRYAFFRTAISGINWGVRSKTSKSFFDSKTPQGQKVSDGNSADGNFPYQLGNFPWQKLPKVARWFHLSPRLWAWLVFQKLFWLVADYMYLFFMLWCNVALSLEEQVDI